jgi:hypothetical protein
MLGAQSVPVAMSVGFRRSNVFRFAQVVNNQTLVRVRSERSFKQAACDPVRSAYYAYTLIFE